MAKKVQCIEDEYVVLKYILRSLKLIEALPNKSKPIRKRASFKKHAAVRTSDSDSDTTTETNEFEGKTRKKEKYSVPLMRILKLNIEDWPYILGGSMASIVMGASLPTFAFILSRFFEVNRMILLLELH